MSQNQWHCFIGPWKLFQAIAFSYVVYYDFTSHSLRNHERIKLLNLNSLDFYIIGLLESFYFTLNLPVHYK